MLCACGFKNVFFFTIVQINLKMPQGSQSTHICFFLQNQFHQSSYFYFSVIFFGGKLKKKV